MKEKPELSEKIEKSQRGNHSEKKNEIGKKKKRGKNVSFLARVGEVRRTMFSQKTIFVLVYKEGCLVSNDHNLSLPSMFQSLLQEFDDVFQDEVPKELPPIRGIGHKIDFIPGAVIPNRPA